MFDLGLFDIFRPKFLNPNLLVSNLSEMLQKKLIYFIWKFMR